MTLIEMNGLDHYTYVDVDGLPKMLDAVGIYDSPGGSIEAIDFKETQSIAYPWLHDFKAWWFKDNYQSCDRTDWDDLPF
jgi:hypothetical protein